MTKRLIAVLNHILYVSLLLFGLSISGVTTIAYAQSLLLPDESDSAKAIVWLSFDNFTDGVRIDEQYATQGVHFLNDYRAGQLYQSSPQIRSHSSARTAPNILFNDFYDTEFYTSRNVPMEIWFDQPVSGVGMWLGTKARITQVCSGSYQATVSVYDCNGSQLQQRIVSVNEAFTTALEIDDALGRIQRVEIDYGDTTCAEAIDEFAFATTTNQCTDNTPPVVTITSHADSSIVNTAQQTIEGTIAESGILKSVLINGSAAEFYRSLGLYHFRATVSLQEGSNTITVLAKNLSGLTGSDQVVITLGTPVTTSIGQFHLTQRGVLLNQSCDVDTPLVAGKSALARLFLSVKTASGKDTYVSSVRLRLWRKSLSGDQLVDTVWGSSISPFISGFNAPNHMAAIHFWIDGHTLAGAGEYKFEFQPYIGTTAIGAPLIAQCGGSYYSFTETKSIDLLILPVEAGFNSPLLQSTDYRKNYLAQLDNLVRTFPVSDDWLGKYGLRYVEAAPFRLCDGSVAMAQNSAYCGGSGWTWKMIDKDPGGVLRRADHAAVTDASQITCDSKNQRIGGRITSANTFTYNFDSALGIFRGGAHPSWNGTKYDTPRDEDHDGDIDNADMAHYVAEFYDQQSNSWRTDLAHYNTGETFRFFRDQNADHCNDRKTEPQADIRTLWENVQKINLLWGPSKDALDAHNKAAAGVSNDLQYASLWFPKKLTAIDNPDFGSYGPGQGQSPGALTWIVLRDTSTMPHELGHNVGGLGDLYLQSTDPAADDMVTKENAWATYIGYQSVPPGQVFAAMGADRAIDRVVHYQPDYQTLFDKLKVTAAAKLSSTDKGVADQLLFSGGVNPQGQLSNVTLDTASGLT